MENHLIVQKNLTKLISQTKEKSWEMGVSGFHFENPQKLNEIALSKKNHLVLNIPLIVERQLPKLSPELKKEALLIRDFAKSLKEAKYGIFEMEYQMGKKKKNTQLTTKSWLIDFEGDQLLKALSQNGFKEKVKEIQLKTMFEKSKAGEYADDFLKEFWEEKKPHFGVLIKCFLEELDQFVVQVEKKIRELRWKADK